MFGELSGKFTLITENRPLAAIFHQKKCLPVMTSQRLLMHDPKVCQLYNRLLSGRRLDDTQYKGYEAE